MFDMAVLLTHLCRCFILLQVFHTVAGVSNKTPATV
jgi:hypothetical protein